MVHASRTTHKSDLPAALTTNSARVPLLPAELKLIRHHPSPFPDLLFIPCVELIGAALLTVWRISQSTPNMVRHPVKTIESRCHPLDSSTPYTDSVNVIIQRSLNGSSVSFRLSQAAASFDFDGWWPKRLGYPAEPWWAATAASSAA